MLGLITHDLIAKQAHYHSSCYKLYTKVNQNKVNSVTADQNEKAICKSYCIQRGCERMLSAVGESDSSSIQ